MAKYDHNKFTITGKLDAFTQLHVARKLSPGFPTLDMLVDPDNQEKDLSVLTVMLLGQISDADSDYVVKKCLSVVARRQADNTLARLTSQGGELLFDDTTMAELMQLTAAVVEENLGDFLHTALGK